MGSFVLHPYNQVGLLLAGNPVYRRWYSRCPVHRFIAMGAAGWHICFDVLDHLLGGIPLGRIVGPEAMKFGWQRLNAEYAKQFGIESPDRPPKPSQKS